MPLKCDNQATIYISKNLVFHEHIKHIKLDCHFVREKLQSGLISLLHLPTKKRLVNALSKPLHCSNHHGSLSNIGLQTISSAWGGGGGLASSSFSNQRQDIFVIYLIQQLASLLA